MRNNTKKWTMFLTAAAMTACLAVAVPSVTAFAEEETTYTEIQSSGFNMEKGAQVRLNTVNPGIRFVTNVTKAFYDSVFDVYPEAASIEFYTEIDRYNNPDGGEAVEVKSSVTDFETEFKTKDTVQYNGAITYENLDESFKAKAYAMELEAYAKCRVLDAEGNVLEILGARRVSPVRSMRMVASAATLDPNYETKYDATEQRIIEKYLGTINNSTDFNAYETVNEADGVSVMDGTIEGNYNKAYVNNVEVGTVENGVVTFNQETIETLTSSTLGYSDTLVLFDDANNVYTSEFMYVTKEIEKQDDFLIFAIKSTWEENLTGYYVLKNDVSLSYDGTFLKNGGTASAREWHSRYDTAGGNVTSFDLGFAGTFDGRGHTITSYVIMRLGLFGYLCGGATIQNVNIHYSTAAKSGTVADGTALTSPAQAKYIYSMLATTAQQKNGNINVKNIYIKNDFTASNTSNWQLMYTPTAYTYFENVIVENPGYKATVMGGALFGTFGSTINKDPSLIENRYKNVYAIAGTTATNDTAAVIPNVVDWSGSVATSGIVAANDKTTDTGASYQISTIYRYFTLAELYATFTESNPLPWNLVDGALVWNQ